MERMASVLFNLRKPEPPVPSSLSQLLRMGIRETVALARDPDYYPTSKSWHEPYHGVCHACLSGALMRGVLLCTPAPQSHFRPGTTRNHWHKALWALEYVREGSLFEAHMELFNLPNAEELVGVGGQYTERDSLAWPKRTEYRPAPARKAA